ncbi:MAG: coproporphyrinogen dehydrogenase HemZ [Lachnospiraceae bacterium]|nr:coproporphyrinogen dehydrogenase HemZ [Lachnospiraceae bacterium]
MYLAVTGENFEYDTYLLIREFYPEEKIVRLYEDTGAFYMSEGGENAKSSAGEEVAGRDGLPQTGLLCEYAEEYTKILYYPGETDRPGEFRYPVSIPKSDKKEYKKTHMGNLYRTLKQITGISLPWGDLTGVRPTKLARTMFEGGASEEDVRKFYREGRFVSEEKSALAIEIAKRELEILKPIDSMNGYSLYIGIPFCPTRCSYCSFLSNPIAMWQERVEEYLSCVKKELDYVKTTFVGQMPDTIYIGGGTPTALSASELEILMQIIRDFLDSSAGKVLEFTVEAGRPDSITREKLRVLKEAGVDRISVNPQTMNDDTLIRIGRKHTVAQTVSAYELAREEGFDNINMDIILGLPGEGTAEIQRTMDEIIRMKPDSLTVHSLAMKRSSGMTGAMLMGEDFDTLGLDRNPVNMMEIAYAGAKELKLKPYYLYRQKNIAGNLENVGFAEEGKFGIYNILMMEEVQSILAIGAGTVSKKVLPGDIKRCDTAKDIGLYMDNIEEMIDRKRELFS